MMILSGQFKALVLAVALVPGTTLQAPAGPEQKTVAIDCTTVPPVQSGTEFYRTRTRAQLIELGQTGDPVGLYYLSFRDEKAGRYGAAREKLERAADAGLISAYRRLTQLRDTAEGRYAAQVCAQRLEDKATDLTQS